MKILFFVKAIVYFTLLHGIVLAGPFNRKNDFQFWQYQQLAVKLNSHSTFYFETEFRWGDDASELFLSYFQSGVRFLMSEWLTIGPGYRHLSLLRRTRERVAVYVPLLEVTLTVKPRKWEIQDRNRTEYFMVDSGANSWIYRNRILCISPWKWGKIGLNPLIFDEIFFAERRGCFENRLGIGGKFSFTKQFSSELCYVLRHIRLPEWYATHVIRVNLSFKY